MGCCSSGPYTEPLGLPTKWCTEFEGTLPSLEGKVVAVTGCTTGTGYEFAQICARKGAHVVMLNRISERSKAAEKAIAESVPGATLTSIACDLQDFGSVRAAAGEMQAKFRASGIDVICNNAGVMALKDAATKDGYDVQMQTNHLSHFLLTREIFPLLETAAEQRGEARIVNHSSLARNGKPLEAKYLGKNGGNLGGDSASMFFGGARWVRYHHTKLANAVFTVALDNKLRAKGSKVKALVAAPGLATTNLQVTAHVDGGMSETWVMKYGQSAADGTMPILHCALVPGVASGAFVEPSLTGGAKGPVKQKPLEKICTSPEACKMLWEESEKATGQWSL